MNGTSLTLSRSTVIQAVPWLAEWLDSDSASLRQTRWTRERGRAYRRTAMLNNASIEAISGTGQQTRRQGLRKAASQLFGRRAIRASHACS